MSWRVLGIFLLSLLLWGACAGAGTDADRTSGATGSSNGGPGAGGTAPTTTGGLVTVGLDGSSTGSGTTGNCDPASGPYCGDGMVNQDSEACDDGNLLPGDGCTGVCAVEPNYACPPEGGACTLTLRCGDGIRSPGEACDDANNDSGDGCSADCAEVEPGFFCPLPGQPCQSSEGECGDSMVSPGETCDDGNAVASDGCTELCRVEDGWRCTQPGMPCVLVPVCPNGNVEGLEECDDGNGNSGDGCSSTCRLEPGFKCTTPNAPCEATVCGDGVLEGLECCDDGNLTALDGCTPDCRCEPECPTQGACTAECGNGIVEEGETCDDGNTLGGDGCSEACATETGFECVVPTCSEGADCFIEVPVIFRDHNASHPDFAPDYDGVLITGLVEPTWDEDKKPVQSAAASEENGFMHGQAAFAEWFRSPNEPGGTGSRASAPIAGSILLWPTESGSYVNRWGASGEQWLGVPEGNGRWCGNPAEYADCAAASAAGQCNNPPFDPTVDSCWEVGAQQGINVPPNCCTNCLCAGTVTRQGYDGNPLFFPLDPPAAGILNDTREAGKVPAQYGFDGWPWEVDVAERLGIAAPIETATAPFPSATHNFHFTTEVKWWFRYDPNTPMTLDFTGDDDVWVFVNGVLAVDLGSWHVPEDGSVTIGPGTAATFGLSAGSVYQIGIFHAERQKEGSTFKLTLTGFGLQPSECIPTCGDGVVTVFEECDEGAANGSACGGCTTQCLLGPRCGDGIVQADCAEACDDGVNIGGYNQCGPGCVPAERCGDGVTQTEFGEACDDAELNGTEGYCDASCGLPAFCGDGVVQAPEETCDNGINDNAYGGCSSDCQFGPRCGDGVTQAEFGELCDLGPDNQDGVYGGCTVACKLGPHCGDGLLNGDEQCDPGDPTGNINMPVGGACSSINAVCSDTCRAMPVE